MKTTTTTSSYVPRKRGINYANQKANAWVASINKLGSKCGVSVAKASNATARKDAELYLAGVSKDPKTSYTVQASCIGNKPEFILRKVVASADGLGMNVVATAKRIEDLMPHVAKEVKLQAETFNHGYVDSREQRFYISVAEAFEKATGYKVSGLTVSAWMDDSNVLDPNTSNISRFDKLVRAFLGKATYEMYEHKGKVPEKLFYKLGLGKSHVDGVDLSASAKEVKSVKKPLAIKKKQSQ